MPDNPTGPFTLDELRDALDAALDRLEVEGSDAIERAATHGFEIVLRGNAFRVKVPNLMERLASRQHAQEA